MDVEILKEGIELARKKKTHIATEIARRGKYPMKRIAESFAISRTNLIVQSRLTSPKKRVVKATNDGALLTDIQNICKKRVTYGYRRVCANINRSYRKRGLNSINHKKVYRVMQENKMLYIDTLCEHIAEEKHLI